jgi:hypothetical protein
VLAALWHQHLKAVLLGLAAQTVIRHPRLGKACGLRTQDYRAALQDLIAERLITRAGVNSYALTPAGHRRAGELLDTAHIVELAKQGRIGPDATAGVAQN